MFFFQLEKYFFLTGEKYFCSQGKQMFELIVLLGAVSNNVFIQQIHVYEKNSTNDGRSLCGKCFDLCEDLFR